MALLIKKDTPPSMLNAEMATGSWVGNILGAFAGALLATTTGGATAIALAGTAIGAYLGGSSGYARMQKEASTGKEVGEPSLFNRESFAYFAGTSVILGLAAKALLYTVGPATLEPIAFTVGIATFAAKVVAPIIGAFVGKNRMANELEEAKLQELQRTQDLVRAVSHQQAPEHETAKSPTHFRDMVAGRAAAVESQIG